MKKVTNLIFDLDGTLIDSSLGIMEAVNYALNETGGESQPLEKITPYIGYPFRVMFPNFSERPIKELSALFRKKALETIVPSSRILPGVEEVLKELSGRGYKMSIATTKIREHIDGILDKFVWHDYFEMVIGGDEVEKVKPDPEMFQTVIDRLNETTISSAVIGDTENDIMAAKAIPVKAVALKCPYGGEENLIASKPDFYLNSISELPVLLSGERNE